MRPALVIGAGGQDGRILTDLLLTKGRPVVGFDRGVCVSHAPGHLRTELAPLELADGAAVRARVRELQPWAIFYLAAVHHSAEDDRGDERALFAQSTAVHLAYAVELLDALRGGCRDGRFFYAASSHLFGRPEAEPQSEATAYRPVSVYGITKAAGAQATAYYRAQHGLHASVGILYNHESPLRPERFLTRKVVLGARAAKAARAAGRPYQLELGSLSDVVDWSWAPDTIDAMCRVVEAETGNDYVIASGELHSVEELCRLAFAHEGLDWREYLREAPQKLKRPSVRLVGDNRRLREVTGWRPTVDFQGLVGRLFEEPPAGWSR